jgi:hypothetical protein
MNNPLRHVGQTARPEDPSAPNQQSGDAGAGAQADQQQAADEGRKDASKQPAQTDAAQSAPANAPGTPAGGQKRIRDLEPGEPPPESSAGS